MVIQNQTIQANLNILRRKQVEVRTGLARSTIYLHVSQGTFPAPIPLGERSVGWLESEVTEWIEECIKQRGLQTKGGA